MMKPTNLKIIVIAIIAIVFNVKTANAQWSGDGLGGIAVTADYLVLNSDDTRIQTNIYFGAKNSNHKFGFYRNYFQLNDELKVQEGTITMLVGKKSSEGWVGTMSNHGLYIGANSNVGIFVDTANNVYVGGIDDTNVKNELKSKADLFVDEGILAEDLLISPRSQWADYVFAEEYTLRPLAEVGEFIKKNKHLPNIPSQNTISEEGYSTHRMNVLFLEKIEELTLYILQQQEEHIKYVQHQEERIKKLNKKIDRLTGTHK